MSMGELLLTLIVTLAVFGPSKMPMVAHHLGKLVNRINYYKQQWAGFWHQQLHAQQLQENIRKAQQADDDYKSNKR